MAVTYENCCFMSVEVGACCSSSDSDVFKISTFGKLLESNKLVIPDSRVLPIYADGLSMPFVPDVEEMLSLLEHVLRTYTKMLTCLKTYI
jgi:hypothetical protein